MKKIKSIFSVLVCLSLVFALVPSEFHNEITEFVFGGGLSLATIYMPGCGTPPAPTCQECPSKELGGIRAIWIQKASYNFANIQDPNEWETAICNGTVFVFPFTNGEMSQDPTMSDGYGNTPQTLDSYTYNLTFHEPQYVNDVPFWNFIKKGISYKVGYKTQTLLHLSAVAAQFTPTYPVVKDVKSKIDTMVKATWVQTDNIQPTPAGNADLIFQTCVDC